MSSFNYYHVLSSLLLSVPTDSSLESLQDSKGKNRCHVQFPSWVCWAGAFSTLVQPSTPSVFCLLEPGSVCFADGHPICSHSQLWIYKFPPLSFFPLCHFTGSRGYRGVGHINLVYWLSL